MEPSRVSRSEGWRCLRVADRFAELRNYGITHAYFLLRLRTLTLREDEANCDDDCDLPDEVSWLDEFSEEVERMVVLVEEYIEFLRECGGCKVDGLDYEE